MFDFWPNRDLCMLVRRNICAFFRDLIASPHTLMQHILIVATMHAAVLHVILIVTTMHTAVLHVILIGKICQNAQIIC